ncbi:alpha/beta fold hydrolase [Allomuricauda sp. M10]|uniref:alpha/beta fold hydrolase n=1 Tax=Allomuricauda sp. M10 TaxID=2683292 RepID=UPI001D18D1CB|nr:alpha/beta hydrolase [Muricauda sp. M10]
MNKKIFALFALLATLSISGMAQNGMRHFMQAEPSPNGAIPYGNNTAIGQYAQAGDAKIYFEVYGEGKPFVILHGGGLGSLYEMGRFIDSLKQDYRVIAISTRGHGRSEIGHSPITYEQKANDVMAAINTVTRDSATVLGFSDGAYAAYKVASLYPSRVKKLIAIGAGEQVPGLRKVILDTQMLNADPLYKAQQLALMPEPDRLQEFWTNLAHFYNEMTASKELFNSIQCPVLLLAGERDGNAPMATVMAAYQMIPNCQLGIVPNAGHVVFLENFDAVWANLKPFLEQ